MPKRKESFKFWMIVRECENVRKAQQMREDLPNYTRIEGPSPKVLFGTKEHAEEIAKHQARKYNCTFYVMEAVSSAEIRQVPVDIYDLK